MAYRKRAKRSYRSSAPKRTYRKKSTTRRKSSGSSRVQTVRLEMILAQPTPSPVPVIGGEFALPASTAKKSKL